MTLLLFFLLRQAFGVINEGMEPFVSDEAMCDACPLE